MLGDEPWSFVLLSNGIWKIKATRRSFFSPFLYNKQLPFWKTEENPEETTMITLWEYLRAHVKSTSSNIISDKS